jgi:hypothetical protein
MLKATLSTSFADSKDSFPSSIGEEWKKPYTYILSYAAHKTWREKLEKPQERKVVDTPKGKMLAPKPLDGDRIIQQVKQGKLITMSHIREKLARDFKADFACPMTTGIFVWIASETSEEDQKTGKLQ